MDRRRIVPPLKNNFEFVYDKISAQPNSQTPVLQTTGGKDFMAEAWKTRDGRKAIRTLPHHNYIYVYDWGYWSNSMGKDGQRIGQYSIPLDRWA